METTSQSGEFRGKSIEAAITAGLTALGTTRERVEIEVLHPGSRGVLGIGAEDARVRLTVAAPAAKPVDKPAVKPAAPKEIAKEIKVEPPQAEPEVAADDPTAETARKLLVELLAHMGLQAQVRTSWQSEPDQPASPPALLLDIMGDDMGILIGRRGETLAALQYVLRLLINQATGRWINAVVDVEEYKARRERNLQQLALHMAERALATRRVVKLEPMSPAERRIIHLTLREHTGVTTISEGEGENRKVTIVPKK